MAKYTEDTIITKVIVLPEAVIVHRADRTLKDGVVIASEPRAHEYAPGHDVSGEDEMVVKIAQAAFTPEAVKKYLDRMERERKQAIRDHEERLARQAQAAAEAP